MVSQSSSGNILPNLISFNLLHKEHAAGHVICPQNGHDMFDLQGPFALSYLQSFKQNAYLCPLVTVMLKML